MSSFYSSLKEPPAIAAPNFGTCLEAFDATPTSFMSYLSFSVLSIYEIFAAPTLLFTLTDLWLEFYVFLYNRMRFSLVNEMSFPMIVSLICSLVAPSNGYLPIIIAYINIPRAQISILGLLALSPCSSSGLIYLILPTLWRSATLPLLDPNIPKSAIFTCTLDGALFVVGISLTFSSRTTFWNFMSRWMIRLLWQ